MADKKTWPKRIDRGTAFDPDAPGQKRWEGVIDPGDVGGREGDSYKSLADKLNAGLDTLESRLAAIEEINRPRKPVNEPNTPATPVTSETGAEFSQFTGDDLLPVPETVLPEPSIPVARRKKNKGQSRKPKKKTPTTPIAQKLGASRRIDNVEDHLPEVDVFGHMVMPSTPGSPQWDTFWEQYHADVASENAPKQEQHSVLPLPTPKIVADKAASQPFPTPTPPTPTAKTTPTSSARRSAKIDLATPTESPVPPPTPGPLVVGKKTIVRPPSKPTLISSGRTTRTRPGSKTKTKLGLPGPIPSTAHTAGFGGRGTPGKAGPPPAGFRTPRSSRPPRLPPEGEPLPPPMTLMETILANLREKAGGKESAANVHRAMAELQKRQKESHSVGTNRVKAQRKLEKSQKDFETARKAGGNLAMPRARMRKAEQKLRQARSKEAQAPERLEQARLDLQQARFHRQMNTGKTGEVLGGLKVAGEVAGGKVGQVADLAQLGARAASGDVTAMAQIAAKVAEEGQKRMEALMNVPKKLMDALGEEKSERVGAQVAGAGESAMRALGAEDSPIGNLFKFSRALLESADKVNTWTAKVQESNFQFAEFSASMAKVQADEEARRIRLEKDRGDRRAAAAQDLAEKKYAADESAAKSEDSFANFKSFLGGMFQEARKNFFDKLNEALGLNNDDRIPEGDNLLSDFNKAMDEHWDDSVYGRPWRFPGGNRPGA